MLGYTFIAMLLGILSLEASRLLLRWPHDETYEAIRVAAFGMPVAYFWLGTAAALITGAVVLILWHLSPPT